MQTQLLVYLTYQMIPICKMTWTTALGTCSRGKVDRMTHSSKQQQEKQRWQLWQL
jgi:hypothetical protein